jgi:chromosome segregation ATPase
MTERYTAITNEMPSLEKKSVQLTKTREEAEKKFENEDMKVRESTEALRKEMAEIEQPLGKI